MGPPARPASSRVGDEVGGHVAAIELHALDHFQLRLKALGLLDSDDALVTDLLHRFGEELTDLGVAVRRNRANLGDFVIRGDLFGVAA